MKILVSTDTSCLTSKNTFEKYDISVFPLNVIIDGTEFLDGITISQDELKDAMRGNKIVKTSTPPLGTVIEYFENLFEKGYDKIIHFTISSKLSSMYQLFTNVAETHFKDRLIVIDSNALTTIMLSDVLYTYLAINDGISVEEVIKEIENRKNKNYVRFIPENLTALKNGGRISPAIAAIANTIGIKPVLSLTDGQLVKESMTRNIIKEFINSLEETSKGFPTSEFDYTLVSFDAKESSVQYIIDYASKILNGYQLIRANIPINVCAHCGPGTIGLVVSLKVNNKSLKDLL